MTTLPAPSLSNDVDLGVGVGVTVGVAAALVEALALVFSSTTPGTGPYQYAGDYWLTASALPHALAAVLVMVGVRRLQGARDGRLGLVGMAVNVVALLALTVVIVARLLVGHEVQGGPTYVLGTLFTFVGTAVFAAGSWRAGLLPRWLLAVWPFAWVIGSFAAVSASPVLLVAWYVALLVALRPGRKTSLG
jgi:hypothetical protein